MVLAPNTERHRFILIREIHQGESQPPSQHFQARNQEQCTRLKSPGSFTKHGPTKEVVREGEAPAELLSEERV